MRLSACCWLCIGLAAACSEETSPGSSDEAGAGGRIVDSGVDAPAHAGGGNGGAVGGSSAAGGRSSEPADAMLDGGPPDVSGAGGSAESGTHHDADARTGEAEAAVQEVWTWGGPLPADCPAFPAASRIEYCDGLPCAAGCCAWDDSFVTPIPSPDAYAGLSSAYSATFAVDAAGRAHIVAETGISTGSPPMYVLRDGADVGTPLPVATADYAVQPRIAVSPAGEPYVVVTSVNGTSPSRLAIRSSTGWDYEDLPFAAPDDVRIHEGRLYALTPFYPRKVQARSANEQWEGMDLPGSTSGLGSFQIDPVRGGLYVVMGGAIFGKEGNRWRRLIAVPSYNNVVIAPDGSWHQLELSIDGTAFIYTRAFPDGSLKQMTLDLPDYARPVYTVRFALDRCALPYVAFMSNGSPRAVSYLRWTRSGWKMVRTEGDYLMSLFGIAVTESGTVHIGYRNRVGENPAYHHAVLPPDGLADAN